MDIAIGSPQIVTDIGGLHAPVLAEWRSHKPGYAKRPTSQDQERTVAIKILPEHLSHDCESRQRFEREARTISSLNHPNICSLYDVGHQEGTDYLVIEFLEGQTLADRLLKGPCLWNSC